MTIIAIIIILAKFVAGLLRKAARQVGTWWVQAMRKS